MTGKKIASSPLLKYAICKGKRALGNWKQPVYKIFDKKRLPKQNLP
jgi:hypothetical protein